MKGGMVGQLNGGMNTGVIGEMGKPFKWRTEWRRVGWRNGWMGLWKRMDGGLNERNNGQHARYMLARSTVFHTKRGETTVLDFLCIYSAGGAC